MVLVSVLTIFAFSGCNPDDGDSDIGSEKDDKLTVEQVVENVAPSVVNIVSDKSLGSGVFFNSEGYIVTNDHVVRGTSSIEVHLSDKRTLTAKRIGTDPRRDLAVIKVEGEDFQAIKFADSSKTKTGEECLAIGNAQGKENTVTKGIVSNLNIDLNDGTNICKYIQTDAPINSGNSGGALVNMKAEIIGINRARLNNAESMGYAIPSNEAKEIAEQLIKKGYISYPYLGIKIAIVESKDKKNQFIKIVDIMPDSPATEAGLKKNDFILKINDVSVNTVSGLREQLNISGIGSVVSIHIWRSEKEQDTIQATLKELPKGYYSIDWS